MPKLTQMKTGKYQLIIMEYISDNGVYEVSSNGFEISDLISDLSVRKQLKNKRFLQTLFKSFVL